MGLGGVHNVGLGGAGDPPCDATAFNGFRRRLESL